MTVRAERERADLGLKANRVFEFTVLDQLELDPPPQTGSNWNCHSIAVIGRRNGAFVTVLDLEGVFDTM